MVQTNQPLKQKNAKFSVGDLVLHKKQGYRAVVIDVDPLFQASGRYNPQAIKHSFAEKNTWYRLLVDNSRQQTYVKEPLLERDSSQKAINNPDVKDHLTLQNGSYHATSRPH